MSNTITADEVIQAIEFELLQGAVSHDDLGEAIQTARRHQNRVRNELLELSRGATSSREVVIRLFQINEMLLTLVQELNAALHALQVEVRRMARVAQVKAAFPTGGDFSVCEPEAKMRATPLPDVERAMRPDALRVEVDVRPTSIPVIGGWIKRLKFALHDLILFYLRQLAQKQAGVNQTYGEWIMHLIETSGRQQIQIDLLRAELAALKTGDGKKPE